MRTNKMTCFVCNEGLFEPGTNRIPKEFRGKTYTIEFEGEACSNCGYVVMEGSDLPDVMRRLADEYRKEENLLTSLEIRSCRNKLNMTQEAFADHLKVGIASVKRWEGGLVQDRAMDELIRMKTDIQYALRNIEDIEMHRGSELYSFGMLEFEDAAPMKMDLSGLETPISGYDSDYEPLAA